MVMGSINFPAMCRKVVGLGLNYRGEVPPSSPPFLFLKPPSSIIDASKAIRIPKGIDTVEHEVELGVVIGKAGKMIKSHEAQEHIAGYVLALDLTAKQFMTADLANRPWALIKGFDTACPVSPLLDVSVLPDPDDVSLTCHVNDQLRQIGNTSQLVWDVATSISKVSEAMSLEQGDLILTGTPHGIDSLRKGDVIKAAIPGIVDLTLHVTS